MNSWISLLVSGKTDSYPPNQSYRNNKTLIHREHWQTSTYFVIKVLCSTEFAVNPSSKWFSLCTFYVSSKLSLYNLSKIRLGILWGSLSESDTEYSQNSTYIIILGELLNFLPKLLQLEYWWSTVYITRTVQWQITEVATSYTYIAPSVRKQMHFRDRC